MAYPAYETTYLTRTELADDQLKALNEKVAEIIKKFDGQILVEEDWGKRKLAYKIEKESRGHYSHVAYTARPDVVAEVERNLRMRSDNVLRFMTIRVADELEPSQFEEFKAKRMTVLTDKGERREIRENREVRSEA